MASARVSRNGVMRFVEKPLGGSKRKGLVYVPTGEVMTSHGMLEEKLREVGWMKRPSDDPSMVQYQKEIHLLFLPRNFGDLLLMHMYDVVVRTRNVFQVRDLPSN